MSKTKTSTRVIYAIILIVMLTGTFGMYFISIQPNQASSINNMTDADQKAELAKIQERYDEYVEKMNKWRAAEGAKLSKVYFDQFKAYKNANKAFNSASIKELSKADLIVGSGAEIKTDTPYQAYYIGWLPSGEVFDSSFDGDKLKMPLDGQGGMIKGWEQGVIGMKIGGVRELSIPADLAYGESGQGSIPANSPIKFVLLAIEPLDEAKKASQPKLEY